jgi:hypothetical protein
MKRGTAPWRGSANTLTKVVIRSGFNSLHNLFTVCVLYRETFLAVFSLAVGTKGVHTTVQYFRG